MRPCAATRAAASSPTRWRRAFAFPRGYAQAIFLYATETRAADYVIVSPDSLGPIAPPADSVLAGYVKAHPERFSTPEYRELEYAAVTPQDVANQVTVTDKMIADEYKAHLTDYMIPEKRDVQQIEFPSQAEAKAAHDKIASGAVTFEALAAERKISAQDLTLGSLSKEDLPGSGARRRRLLAAGEPGQPAGQRRDQRLCAAAGEQDRAGGLSLAG